MQLYGSITYAPYAQDNSKAETDRQAGRQTNYRVISPL